MRRVNRIGKYAIIITYSGLVSSVIYNLFLEKSIQLLNGHRKQNEGNNRKIIILVKCKISLYEREGFARFASHLWSLWLYLTLLHRLESSSFRIGNVIACLLVQCFYFF
jgi:hypothetical protein